MSSSKSNFHTSSPSFPSVQQVSGDIFFQVKKQILDKLDIILQKVNLEVIDYLKPDDDRKQDKKAFRFIEMSSFQKEIQTLFDYFDRLYQSLNSSISFSSNDIKNTLNNTESNRNKPQSINQYNSVLESEITQMKVRFQQLGEQNIRLREENEHMRFLLKNNFNNSLSLTHSINQDSKTSLKNNQNQQNNNNFDKSPHSRQGQKHQGTPIIQQGNSIKSASPIMQGISLETVKKILRFYNHSIRQLSIQHKQSVKEIKKTLKQVKFQAIQNRVQCIAQLKKWTEFHNQPKQLQISNQKEIATNSKVSPIGKTNSQQLSIQKQNQAICSEDCLQKYYIESGSKNCFEQDLLERIQQILDVC